MRRLLKAVFGTAGQIDDPRSLVLLTFGKAAKALDGAMPD
jgi:hypothetical protein